MLSNGQRRRCVMIALLTLLVGAANAQQTYTVKPLNFGAPNTAVTPYINNVGQVVGTGSSAYLYDVFAKTTTNLGNVLYVVGLNDAGMIVTNDVVPVFEPQESESFMGPPSPGPSSGALYQFRNGGLSLVASLGIYPTGINNAGQVSGDIPTQEGPGAPYAYGSAVYDSTTGSTTIINSGTVSGDGGGERFYSAGISSSGVLAAAAVVIFDASVASGSSPAGPSVDFFPFVGIYDTDPGSMTLMNCVTPTAINALGEVTGFWFSPSGEGTVQAPYRAFLSGDYDLGVLGACVNSYAYALNDSGTVVGSSDVDTNSPPTEHAFVYANGAMTDLNTVLVNGTGWTLNSALAINNTGYIVGIGTFNGTSTYYLLSPRPTPLHVRPPVSKVGARVTGGLGAIPAPLH